MVPLAPLAVLDAALEVAVGSAAEVASVMAAEEAATGNAGQAAAQAGCKDVGEGRTR